MAFCSHCGAQIADEAVICVKCGCSTGKQAIQFQSSSDATLDTVIKIFMIIGIISTGWCLIPLAWTIPMTVVTFRKLKNGEPLGLGFKICTLIFVNLVAGICMLVKKDE